MSNDENHQRQMLMNAHLVWGMAMWGSAEVAAEDNNLLLACYGYYYAAFHAGFALLATDHTYHMDDMERMKHSKLESWLQTRCDLQCQLDFALLQQFREATSYLGVGSPASKFRVVRGHPFGFEIGKEERLGFLDAVQAASVSSKRVIFHILTQLGAVCEAQGWPGPQQRDDWVTEYLQEDVLSSVIPYGQRGSEILKRAFSLLEGAE